MRILNSKGLNAAHGSDRKNACAQSAFLFGAIRSVENFRGRVVMEMVSVSPHPSWGGMDVGFEPFPEPVWKSKFRTQALAPDDDRRIFRHIATRPNLMLKSQRTSFGSW